MATYDGASVETLLALTSHGTFTTPDGSVFIWRPNAVIDPDAPSRYCGFCHVCVSIDDGRPWLANLSDAQAIGAFLARHDHGQSPPAVRQRSMDWLRYFVDALDLVVRARGRNHS